MSYLLPTSSLTLKVLAPCVLELLRLFATVVRVSPLLNDVVLSGGHVDVYVGVYSPVGFTLVSSDAMKVNFGLGIVY